MFLFTKIDLLGVPATLNFFGNDKKKSNFGGICSILFLVFVAWTIYNSSLDLINRTNPKVAVSEISLEDPREVNISLDAFPMAFIVQGSTTYNNATGFTNESIYTLKVNHLLIQRVLQPDGSYTKITTRTPLQVEKCTKEYFGEYASSFKTFTFQGSYCISKSQTGLDQLKFQGIYSSAIYHAITASVKLCTSATSNGTCGTTAEITTAMSGSYFNAVYLDSVMNVENFSNPIGRSRQLYTTMMNPASYKEVNLDVGKMDITTDSGWLVEDNHESSTFKVTGAKEIVDQNPSLSKTLMYCYFQGSRIETYYTRSYKKIPTVLAEVGSLANAFLGIMLILVSPYLRLKSREALMNELFDVQAKQEDSKKLKNRKTTSSFYERQTSSGNPKKIRIEDNLDVKRTFTSEMILSKENFQTSPNEIQESPKGKLTLKPNTASEADEIISPPWSPKDPKHETDQGLFYKPEKKRQNEEIQYSQLVLATPRESSVTSRENNTTQRLISEKITIMGGDRMEDKELNRDEFEDDIEKQLENIDNATVKVEGNVAVQEDLGLANVKLAIPLVNINDEKEEGTNIQTKGKGVKRGKSQFARVKDSIKNKIIIGKSTELRIWEYIMSFFYKPKALRTKIETIEEGVKNIEERLDLNNILKKFSEVDKLIALLLDRDQLELFDNMPKPHLNLQKKERETELERQITFEENLSKKSSRISKLKTLKNEDHMKRSYERIKQKTSKSDLDSRLVAIFKDQFY